MFGTKIAKRVISYLRKKNVNFIISYINLRRLIGILGILLPVVCFFGGWLRASLPLQQSISFYYHTNVRDYFVGVLVLVSLFLITYKGHEVRDNILTTITGFFGLGVVTFPCLLDKEIKTSIDCLLSTGVGCPIGFFQLNPECSDNIHMICSVFFFFLLAANSYCLFTLTDETKEMTDNKKKRNRVYKACGIVMGISLITLVILYKCFNKFVEENRIVFYLETIMVVSFGVSWLVKGETFFRDPKSKKSKRNLKIAPTGRGSMYSSCGEY